MSVKTHVEKRHAFSRVTYALRSARKGVPFLYVIRAKHEKRHAFSLHENLTFSTLPPFLHL